MPEVEPEVSAWTAEHLASLDPTRLPAVPLIAADEARPLLADKDLWDYWPLQLPDGSPAEIDGGRLWMMLSAPRLADPGNRHDVARIRLMHQHGCSWRDRGELLPPELNPGSREWSGSALLEPHSAQVTLFFTAAGERGEPKTTFQQRLFQTTGRLHLGAAGPLIRDWSRVEESVVSDGVRYFKGPQALTRPRFIKGFRDPYWFLDPADHRGYLLFTGTLAAWPDDFGGTIGLASAASLDQRSEFSLLPPVLHASGLVSELERPHVIARDGLYYLFWSCTRRAFAPVGRQGPTGLYGMVGRALRGPYIPLNGSGLVLTNPPDEPDQTYCWQVLPDLSVTSFVDQWGMHGRSVGAHPQLLRSHFGGTPAPQVRIALDGESSRVLPSAAGVRTESLAV